MPIDAITPTAWMLVLLTSSGVAVTPEKYDSFMDCNAVAITIDIMNGISEKVIGGWADTRDTVFGPNVEGINGVKLDTFEIGLGKVKTACLPIRVSPQDVEKIQGTYAEVLDKIRQKQEQQRDKNKTLQTKEFDEERKKLYQELERLDVILGSSSAPSDKWNLKDDNRRNEIRARLTEIMPQD